MIITRTPFRISFFGGGTDYPAWYRKEGGAVLSTTIDKYCYISARYLPPFFKDLKHRIVWRHVEAVDSIADILHPAVRECLRFLGFDDSRGLEIIHQGDLPARSGIGSSSSFVVGLLRALIALRGGEVNSNALAQMAIEVEQDRLKENVGCQDQISAAVGGLKHISFLSGGSFVTDSMAINLERKFDLESRLMLFYSGGTHLSTTIGKDIAENINENIMRSMMKLVDDARDVLEGDEDINEFGHLLHETWTLKKNQSRLVSNDLIDGMYRKALQNGALGGKLCGAGSSGFMLFFVPPERQETVKFALSEYLYVPFKFENEGSVILHNSEEK